MARTALSPQARAQAIHAANERLRHAVPDALSALARFGPADPRTLAAWETVEQHGATVHRQARLLAGKSRGG